MAEIRVNPTRMEQKKLKSRLAVARRGHKLMRDKRDELMRQFLDVVKEAAELRRRVEEALVKSYRSFSAAAALTSPKQMSVALMLAGGDRSLKSRPRTSWEWMFLVLNIPWERRSVQATAWRLLPLSLTSP